MYIIDRYAGAKASKRPAHTRICSIMQASRWPRRATCTSIKGKHYTFAQYQMVVLFEVPMARITICHEPPLAHTLYILGIYLFASPSTPMLTRMLREAAEAKMSTSAVLASLTIWRRRRYKGRRRARKAEKRDKGARRGVIAHEHRVSGRWECLARASAEPAGTDEPRLKRHNRAQ